MRFIVALILALIFATCCQAQTPGVVYIVDDGVSTGGSWNAAGAGGIGVGGDAWWTNTSGSRRFEFDATPGDYRVWVRWVHQGAVDGTATWTVSVAGVALASASVGAMWIANDVEIEGLGWKELDEFVIDSETTVVVDVDVTVSGFFCPDAIAFMKLDTGGGEPGGGEPGGEEVYLTSTQWAEVQDMSLLLRLIALCCGWQVGQTLWTIFLIAKRHGSFL